MVANSTENADEALMLRYQQGDDEAFTELYREYAPRVYGYLRNRVSDRHKVDELFQLVFLKLHQSRAQYDSQFPFSPWLFTICRTVLIDALRGGRMFNTVENANFEVAAASIGEAPALYREEAVAEKVQLNKLPADKKMVLEMRYFENLSFDAIAKRLKISEPTARQRVSRAVRSLKEMVKGKT